MNLQPCFTVHVDQCALGLSCPRTEQPVKKPTCVATSSYEVSESLKAYRCSKDHDHGHLEGKFGGKNLTELSDNYPSLSKFCRVVRRASVSMRPTSASHTGKMFLP